MNQASELIFKVTTEMVYFGSYGLLIVVVILTVFLARRAARMNDLEEAMKNMDDKKRRNFARHPMGEQEHG